MYSVKIRLLSLWLCPAWFVPQMTGCSDSGGDPAQPGTTTTGTTSNSTSSTTATTATTSATGSTGSSSTTGSATVTTGTTSSNSATATTTTSTSATTSGSTATGTTTTSGTSAGGASSTASNSVGTGGAGGATSTTGGATNAALSDNFEAVAAGGPPDAALWQLRVPSGQNSIEVTTEQAHGGTQSVKVTGASGSTMFFTENVFPLPSGVVYFRVWVRFSNADWANHNAFVESSPGEESQEVRFGGQNNAYHANLAADGDALSPDPYESPSCSRCVAPVADVWTCLRGKLDFANNVAQLYVDDALAVDSEADGWHNNSAGMFPQNPTQIGFGWALYGAMPNTVYYDDLAIGYEAIACD